MHIRASGSGLGAPGVSMNVTASDMMSSILQISFQSQKENTRHGIWGPMLICKTLASQLALSYVVEQI